MALENIQNQNGHEVLHSEKYGLQIKNWIKNKNTRWLQTSKLLFVLLRIRTCSRDSDLQHQFKNPHNASRDSEILVGIDVLNFEMSLV